MVASTLTVPELDPLRKNFDRGDLLESILEVRSMRMELSSNDSFQKALMPFHGLL
jgi:hypothetical protein